MWAQVCFWHNLHLCVKEKSFFLGLIKKQFLLFIKKWWKNTTVYSNFYQQKFKFKVHSIDTRDIESSWQLNYLLFFKDIHFYANCHSHCQEFSISKLPISFTILHTETEHKLHDTSKQKYLYTSLNNTYKLKLVEMPRC